jgi:hypothetical protein
LHAGSNMRASGPPRPFIACDMAPARRGTASDVRSDSGADTPARRPCPLKWSGPRNPCSPSRHNPTQHSNSSVPADLMCAPIHRPLSCAYARDRLPTRARVPLIIGRLKRSTAALQSSCWPACRASARAVGRRWWRARMMHAFEFGFARKISSNLAQQPNTPSTRSPLSELQFPTDRKLERTEWGHLSPLVCRAQLT